jgi:hypothetical protein
LSNPHTIFEIQIHAAYVTLFPARLRRVRVEYFIISLIFIIYLLIKSIIKSKHFSGSSHQG